MSKLRAIFFHKKTKILLTVLACFLLITLLTRTVLKRYYRATARHYATLDHVAKVTKKDNIDYLIIGDSTGLHSLIPKLISENTYSVCISGASLFDAYKTLSKFNLSHIKKGIILSNSFNSDLHYSEDFWRRFVLTHSYSHEDLREFYNESLDQKTYPSSQYGVFEYYITAFSTRFLPNKFSLEALSGYLRSMRWSTNFYQKYSNSFNENNGYVSLEEPRSQFQLTDEDFFMHAAFYRKPFKISKTDEYYLIKIYHLLRNAGLPLILATMPTAEDGANHNISAFTDTFTKYFRDFAITHPHFTVIPVKLRMPRSYFFDFNHVKMEGAKMTTMEFSRLLKKVN